MRCGRIKSSSDNILFQETVYGRNRDRRNVKINTCLYKRFIVGGNFVAVEVKDKMAICDEQNRVTLTNRLPVLQNHRKRIKNHYMNLRSKTEPITWLLSKNIIPVMFCPLNRSRYAAPQQTTDLDKIG